MPRAPPLSRWWRWSRRSRHKVEQTLSQGKLVLGRDGRLQPFHHLVVALALEAGLDCPGVQPTLSEPTNDRTGEAVSHPNLTGAGCLYAGQQTGPIHVVRRSEEHTSELQSRQYLVCRLLLEKKKKKIE